MVNTLDAARVHEFLARVQEPYQAALGLFYMEDYSYQEIAEILEVPLGTVRSRISRGLAQLRRLILDGAGATSLRPTPVSDRTAPASRKPTERPLWRHCHDAFTDHNLALLQLPARN